MTIQLFRNTAERLKSPRGLLQWYYFNFTLLRFLLNMTLYFMGLMTLWLGIFHFIIYSQITIFVCTYTWTEIHLNENSLILRVIKKATKPHRELQPANPAGQQALQLGTGTAPPAPARLWTCSALHPCTSSLIPDSIKQAQLQREGGRIPPALSWSMAQLQVG